MPVPTEPEVIEAILEDVRAGELSCRAIARKHDISTATVRKYTAEAGITDAFSRAQTENATRAKTADNRSRRAALAEKFLALADQLLDQVDKPHVVHSFGGRDNTFASEILDRPPTSDIRNLMTAAAVAVDKSIAIDRHDTKSGADTVASLLGDLFGGLVEKHGTGDTSDAAAE